MSKKRETTSTAQPTANGTPARTATETKLWNALTARPGVTTAELAGHAGIGASTAGKALSRWLSAGHVTRAAGAVDDDGSGKRRAAGTWTIVEPTTGASEPDTATTTADMSVGANVSGVIADAGHAPTRSQAHPERDETKEPTGQDVAAHNTNGARKLRGGELRGQVEDALRERPELEFSPVQIANKLGGRSSGAVANCLERLTDAGVAERTSDKPKRYRLAAGATAG